MKKAVTISALLLISLFMLTSVRAEARTEQLNIKSQVQNLSPVKYVKNSSAAGEMVRNKVENRCELIESRVDNRLNIYQVHKDQYNNRYQGVVKRLADLFAILEEKGCDTTVAQANLTTFKGMIEDFAAAFRLFINSLTGSKQYACGESQGKFIGQISTAQSQLSIVKSKSIALRNYYSNTLKPSIKSLRYSCSEAVAAASQEAK